LVGRLVAGLVAGLLFGPVAGLAHRLHDGLLDRLVASVEPLLEHGIVHQLVAGATLLLAGAEAALGVATRLGTAGVLGGAVEGGMSRGGGPEQAGHGARQRRTQAHPHDSRLLFGPRGPLRDDSRRWWGTGGPTSGVLDGHPPPARTGQTVPGHEST